MPELPEVETVRRTLAPIIGAKISSVTSSGFALRLGEEIPVPALRLLIGQRIERLRRIGKYLLLEVTGAKGILVHLGMSGRLRVFRASDPVPPHTHLVLGLEGPGARSRELRYSDARRFGQVSMYDKGDERSHAALAGLGPDPLEAGLDGAKVLLTSARRRRVTLKALVLDQGVIAGMGNIYASEALWLARLRPTARTPRLTEKASALLWQAIQTVLDHALTHGGTTLRDFVAADGSSGEHADYLHVYGRDGEACSRCQAKIRRIVQQGRATYFCPTCQPS
jgi:formamidopyrimidine-DNA glycosylase